MSRRRNPKHRPSHREVRLICTGGGSHQARLIARIEVRRGRQLSGPAGGSPWEAWSSRPHYVDNTIGRSRADRPFDEGRAFTSDGYVKGVRGTCPDCGIDVNLRDETIDALFPDDEVNATYTVDVSGGATVPEQ